MTRQIKTMQLGELLVSAGAITPANLKAALSEQKVSQMRLGEILIKNGYLTELHLAEALSQQLGYQFISLVNTRPQHEAIASVPENVAERLNVLPLSIAHDGKLVVAMSDPMNTYAIEELRMLGREINIKIATSSDIKKGIASYYKMQTSLNEAIIDIKKQNDNLGTDVITISPTVAQEVTTVTSDDAPVVRLVNTIFEQAVREKASDIHIEPSENDTHVRMRIDGTLFNTVDIPKNLHPPFIARIKILSGMDIAEKRRPQDGRILIMVSGRRIDLRVSTLPSIYGEKAVLRLLDQDNEHVGISKLGFDKNQVAQLTEAINAAHGMVLATGPTGSGKSTTLYSLLEIINKPEVNIVTIEDPVEYTINGITQVQVNEKVGLSFSNALRSILRQDPDKMMVGEIRDSETAHLAIRAALTGHLILSTLHTNDAPSSINRLLDMGVPTYLLSSSLRCVIAQRLVRKLCNNCKNETEVTEKMSQNLGIPAGAKIYEPVGCPECRFTGYNGRTIISEIMMVDEHMRDMINNNSPMQELRDYDVSQGMTTLRDSACKKVADGITSAEEMLVTTVMD